MLLVAIVTGANADTTFKCKLNGEVVQERNDGESGDFFTFSFSSGSYGWKGSSDVAGCTYDGVNYTSALKFDSKPTLSFTTTEAATIIVVQSTSRNSDKAPKLDGTAMSSSTSITGANVWTATNVAAGSHNVKYNSEIWIHCVYVIYPGAAKTYTVTAATNNSAYGTASTSASSLDKDEKATITATPKSGYEFTSWAVEGEGAELSSTTTNPTTLTMGTANATVTATFSAINYAITHNAATGGTYTISVAGGDATDANTTATIGQTITLAGTPTNPAHTYVAWNVTDANDAAVTVTNNQFTMPASNVTIAPVFSKPLNTLFEMKSITSAGGDLSKGDKADVVATFTEGGSAEVYQNASGGGNMYYNGSINLNGSGGSYIHITFPTKLVAGDVITATFLGGNDAWKLSKTTSGAASKTNPYTIAANDALLGATELYIFKDGSAQVSALKIEGQGELSDLTVTSSATPTVAMGATSDIEYTTSSTGAVTFTSSDESVAKVSDTGVITAVEGGTATITISQDADETYRAGEATVTVTVPERAIIRLTLPGGTNTGDAPGTIGGTYDGKTHGRNNGGCKLGSTGHYIGLTLATGNSFQEGDIVEVKFVGEAPMTGDDSKVIFYDSKEQTNVIYNTETSPALGTYRYILPEGANGQTSLYLVRGTEKNSKFNPFIDYIAVYRPNTTVSLNAKGFATYSSSYDFEYAGADAYGMKLTETSLSGTKVTAGKIKAGEGILFKGKANAKVYILETAGAAALENNSLIGTTDINNNIVPSTYTYKYALSGDTFKKLTGALVANKAFFGTNEELSNSLDIVFDGATAINNVNANDNANSAAPVKVVKNGQLFIGNYNVAGARIK